MRNEYDLFATKIGYNKALRHFKKVNSLLPRLVNENLADLINSPEIKSELSREQIKPIIHALLVDKFNYYHKSINLTDEISSPQNIVNEIITWKAVDFVILYNDDSLGETAINPKNLSHWKMLGDHYKNKLITIYAKFTNKPLEKEPEKHAVNGFIQILKGEKIIIPAYYKSGFIRKDLARKRVLTSANVLKQDTDNELQNAATNYSLQINNTHFQFSNIEAWKNIIESYEYKYPNNKILIFYNGEMLNKIITLYKLAKIDAGTVVTFCVTGDKPKELNKLYKYLSVGAGPKFEVFLQNQTNKVLEIF
ncbi:MAG: hypothetical protein OEV44_04555 [Spirochaetota bacterium]|nr:hypothetical protein [Spirochaetota bacterium]